MKIRQVFFWLHLAAGAIAGIVVFIMSVTGVMLMYEKQMMTWVDTKDKSVAPPPGASRLPVEALLAKVRDEKQALPATIAIQSDPREPAALAFGREGMQYVNAYTGDTLGGGATGLRQFFRTMTDWHRWLGVTGEGRDTARAITGACNLAFLFIVVSGLYLWWPRKWTWQHVKPVVLFRGGLSGKARDFNWHNVIGVWGFVPLFFVVLSGSVISYPWMSNLVYRVAGTEVPTAPGRGGEKKGGSEKKGGFEKKGAKKGFAEGPRVNLDLTGFNDAWAAAEKQVPGWKTITLRLPVNDRAPLAFTIDEGYAGQPQKRATLTVARNGEVERLETFSDFDAGRRLRSWLRFVHTGEYYGIPGQTIAGIASAGAAVLVWTGLALALRRFAAWRSRSSRAQQHEVAEVAR
jgi:uncharacterized iron-regulated membrane protein